MLAELLEAAIVRVLYPMVAASMLVLLGGCLGAQRPIDVAAGPAVPVGVMPPMDDAGRLDPKAVTRLKSSDSILVETPADAAAARAQKRAMMKSFENGAKAPVFSQQP